MRSPPCSEPGSRDVSYRKTILPVGRFPVSVPRARRDRGE